jgi:integrase
MTDKKDTTHVLIAHSLVIFQRPRSTVWQCRYQVDGKWQRESTKQYDLKKAKATAHDLLVEANVRKKLKAAPITRTFKDIAKQAILRMEKEIADGDGKSMYKEYISIIENYLNNFFGKYKVDAISHQLIEEFDEWRIKRMGSVPTHSTILNHNAALNRVFDEAIYRGFMYEINRPKLLAIGKKSERKPAFDIEEVRALSANFDNWIDRARTDSIEIRRLLRDCVIILLDTGMRPGVEINELLWSQIEIKLYPENSEANLDPKLIDPNEPPSEDESIWINPNITAILKIKKSKTGPRDIVGRSPTVSTLREIAKRNYAMDLLDVIKRYPREKIIAYRELVTDRQKDSDRDAKLKDPTSFSRLFDTYLKEHNLLIDPITNKRRVLYSLRHTYATISLQFDNVDIHTLSVQMGTSVGMIEKHYSHLDAVKAVNKLRGEQSRKLMRAHGAIDDRFKWDEEKSKTPKKKAVAMKKSK